MKKLNLVLLFFLASNNIVLPDKGDASPIYCVVATGIVVYAFWLACTVKLNNQKKLREEKLAQKQDIYANTVRPAIVAVEAVAEDITLESQNCSGLSEVPKEDVSAFDTQTRSNENEGMQQDVEPAKNDSDTNFRDVLFYTY